jgi:hypothetical protein
MKIVKLQGKGFITLGPGEKNRHLVYQIRTILLKIASHKNLRPVNLRFALKKFYTVNAPLAIIAFKSEKD